ncbi:hypothetical protein FKP32DRAFT_763435 [Trametes sanguinea]|nr:hypothetical protein FKP32DRAFT_763435 [Trametes sanguinea]
MANRDPATVVHLYRHPSPLLSPRALRGPPAYRHPPNYFIPISLVSVPGFFVRHSPPSISPPGASAVHPPSNSSVRPHPQPQEIPILPPIHMARPPRPHPPCRVSSHPHHSAVHVHTLHAMNTMYCVVSHVHAARALRIR